MNKKYGALESKNCTHRKVQFTQWYEKNHKKFL